MAISNVEGLFRFCLSNALDMEQRLVPILGTLANEVDNDDFRQALLKHQQQTQHHAENIQKCLQIVQGPSQPGTCLVVQALQTEHDNFISQQSPSKPIITMFDLGAGGETESYEIGVYNSLIEMADSLGQQQCIPLFEENLGDEQWMDRTVLRVGRNIGRMMRQAGMTRTA